MAPQVIRGVVAGDPGRNVDIAGNAGTSAGSFEVGAGTALVRIVLDGGSDDLDLYLYAEDGRLVASSTAMGSVERVDLTAPEAGTYTVMVHGWEVAGIEAAYELTVWVVGDATDARLTVVGRPAVATQNGGGVVTVAWSDAQPGAELLGAVTHADAVGNIAVTAISVDPVDPVVRGPLNKRRS